MAVSQNGWPVYSSSDSLNKDAFVPGSSVEFLPGIRGGDVSTVLLYVADQLNRRVEPASQDIGCWGWAKRNVRGSKAVSNHSSATAIDYNADRHFLGRTGTFTGAQVRTIHEILREVDGVVRWGGDYSGRKDEMHFEINASPARVAAAAEKIRKGTLSSTPEMVQRGNKGPVVAQVIQHLIDAGFYKGTNDSAFGPLTEAAVKAFQASRSMPSTGVVDKATWTKLLEWTRWPLDLDVSKGKERGSFLKAGEALLPGDTMTNGQNVLALQKDGNLVLYKSNKPVWATFHRGDNFAIQSDNRMVLRAPNGWPTLIVECSGPIDRLSLNSDGNLVAYDAKNRPLWQTETYR